MAYTSLRVLLASEEGFYTIMLAPVFPSVDSQVKSSVRSEDVVHDLYSVVREVEYYVAGCEVVPRLTSQTLMEQQQLCLADQRRIRDDEDDNKRFFELIDDQDLVTRFIS